jgi:isoamylase
MRFKKIAAGLCLHAAALFMVSTPAEAAINANNLGAAYNAGATSITFNVFSSRATRIELEIYAAPTGQQEKTKILMTKGSNNVWTASATVASLQALGVGTVYYGYRAWGPNWTFDAGWTKGSGLGFHSDVDSAGNRFNPNKVLFDPYALELSHDPTTPNMTDGTVYNSGATTRNTDTGIFAPKSIVLGTNTLSVGTRPTHAQKDDIVYEVNLRGLTENDSSIPTASRGTYAGAALKAGYLASLGITAVEFEPVQEFENDTNDVDPNSDTGDSFWGYSTLAFFAPDRRYSSNKAAGGPTNEFKAMVKAFHDQGIKVYIDVVYNHIAEGGNQLFSMNGFDNPTYNELSTDLQSRVDNTCCGNYNTYNTIAQNLIVDSLAYWSNSLGVDGFRFDLAPVLGNTCTTGCFNYNKTDPGTALNRLAQSGELTIRPEAGGTGIELIGEPWIGGGCCGYEVGNLPAKWSEWNDQFRDTFRASQNQYGVVGITPSQLATRFAGSSDLYQGNGRKPWNSINFMVAHDGLTLKDLYSCNGKNNTQAWPYGPSDGGSDNNRSWDQNSIAQDQRKAARNGFALMMLSAGTPMMTGGDEFLRTIKCNNNPYNLDSIATWHNYTWTTDQTNHNTFAKRLIAFRKAHAALRPANFFSGTDHNANGMNDIDWFTDAGVTPSGSYWSNTGSTALAYRIDGSEYGDANSAIYVAYNGWTGNINFTLPWPGNGKNWYRVMDTSNWNEGANTVVTPGSETFLGGQGYVYGLNGRAMLLLIAK